jgi:hypothetical protein
MGATVQQQLIHSFLHWLAPFDWIFPGLDTWERDHS